MSVKVFIPTPLRPYTDKHEVVEVDGITIDEVLKNLTSVYRPLYQHLYSEQGTLRSYVNIYLNDNDIRYISKEKTPVKDNDSVSIVPSIAGGIDYTEPSTLEEIQLSKDEILRYSRHLIIPEVGVAGQKKIKSAKVLVIGAGGLGSPLVLYLAASGIGKIGIVDYDVVDETNLQRQIMHTMEDIGKSKLESAEKAIAKINPNVETETYNVQLSSENALDILKEYDVIVDGTDNFPTRYLVNDACVLLGKPNVYGSIFRFDGQITVFDGSKGPCYRCLYPSPPPPGLVPSCAEGGVLGVLPGIIGTLQALETLKLVLGAGETLAGRLVLFDALKFSFREFKLKKNPDCPICGKNPTIHELIDYQQFCGVGFPADSARDSDEPGISVEELKSRIDNGDDLYLLDVREPNEYEIANLGGHLIPLAELANRVGEIDPYKEVIVYCKTGGRSARAVQFLQNAGFSKVKNLLGGIDAWSRKIDPLLPRY